MGFDKIWWNLHTIFVGSCFLCYKNNKSKHNPLVLVIGTSLLIILIGVLYRLKLARNIVEEPYSDRDFVRDDEVGKVVSGTGCKVSGCNGELCVSADVGGFSPCVAYPRHNCFKGAECAVQSDGNCGWTQTPELTECLEKTP